MADGTATPLPLIRPNITFDDVEQGLREVFRTGILTRGPFLQQFEDEFAGLVGAAHAVAVTSATTALHLALVAAGIGPGDEVLVSDFSFPASGNVVFQAGATPVLVDCLPGRFELDVERAEAMVTARTRAIMHVDPFGRPADLEAVAALATRHSLLAVEDAACAVGSSFAGRPVGSWPGVAAFSFHPRKLLTTGEGGAVTTDDADLARRMRLLRSHGAEPTATGLRFVEPGYNYRMNEVQAVMGLAQLRRLDETVRQRRATAELYDSLITEIPGVKTVPAHPRSHPNQQSYVVWVEDASRRDHLQRAMRDTGIETTLGTYAMHAHPAFGRRLGHAPGDLPHSYAAQQHSLTLPLVPDMEPADVRRVCTALTGALGATDA